MRRWYLSVAIAVASIAGAGHADMAETDDSHVWRPADGDEIHFDVLRQGKTFGTHRVTFEQADTGMLNVSVDVNLKAGLGPITLFRYELDSSESWQGGALVALSGRVNEDGTREAMTAVRDGDRLVVDGDAYRGEVPLEMLPASHWNIAQTRASQLLSSENGERIDVEVRELGRETISAGGQTIQARKFLMDSDIDVTLWYDDRDRWVKLAFEARGQQIEYVLRDLY
ncbi:MAG: DUF6134 family protein [Hyphomonadaceae bacterium]|nr:DUF6134 family protein [Hyphomonadaceae bacterium]